MPWTRRSTSEIEIRGKRWRWTVLGPEPEAGRRRGDDPEARTFVAFRDPDDPVSEMRCAVPAEAGEEELTEGRVRELFEQAWAVRS